MFLFLQHLSEEGSVLVLVFLGAVLLPLGLGNPAGYSEYEILNLNILNYVWIDWVHSIHSKYVEISGDVGFPEKRPLEGSSPSAPGPWQSWGTSYAGYSEY